MTRLVYWLKEIRAPFLSLSVVLVFLGTAVAVGDHPVHLGRAFLAVIGLILLHVSVNVLNEYGDYHSGVDFHTSPTPFSGGSGMLTGGFIEPSHARSVGYLCFLVSFVIGIYFVWVTNLLILPLLLVGAFSVYSYTSFLARHALGEIFAGLGLGLLPVLGAYFVQTGEYGASAFAASVAAGILTFNLLLINEFPDLEADIRGGRKNLVMTLGLKPAGRLYSFLMAAMYVWIVVCVASRLIPLFGLLSVLTLPIAWKPMRWAWSRVGSKDALVPALGANVTTNLGTQALLGIGFILSTFL